VRGSELKTQELWQRDMKLEAHEPITQSLFKVQFHTDKARIIKLAAGSWLICEMTGRKKRE
jgi:hypothetical protein